MACAPCQHKQRQVLEALGRGAVVEAARHVVEGAQMMVGAKPKAIEGADTGGPEGKKNAAESAGPSAADETSGKA